MSDDERWIDDDEELDETPKEVVNVLGFDPREEDDDDLDHPQSEA